MSTKTEPKGPRPPLLGLLKITVGWAPHVLATYGVANNVLHARWSDNAEHEDSDLVTANNDFVTAFNTAFLPSVSSDWAINYVHMQALGGSGLEALNTTVTQGSGAAGALPPSVACCVSWKAGVTWRGGRPRTYLPGVPLSAQAVTASAGLLSTYTAPLQTRANAFISAVNAITVIGTTITLGMPSYFSNYAFRPTPLFFPITSSVVHDRMDSQRRRSGKESRFSID